MSDYLRLHADELTVALFLFQKVGLNTAEIAKDIFGSIKAEPAVANSLADWREQEYEKRRAA